MICEVKYGFATIVSKVGQGAEACVSYLPAAFADALAADGRYRVTRVKQGGIALGVTWTYGRFPAEWTGAGCLICRAFLRSIGVRVRKGHSTIRLKVSKRTHLTHPHPCE